MTRRHKRLTIFAGAIVSAIMIAVWSQPALLRLGTLIALLNEKNAVVSRWYRRLLSELRAR
jgi:hypothetical protein